MSSYGVIFVVLFSLLRSSKSDPCENNSPLPFPYDRYVTNNISGSEVSVLHDRHIEEAWYRAGHSLDMTDTPPAHLQCGTTFPVWMDGNIPNASDGEVDRTACIVGAIAGNYNNCVHHLEIRVKNCGNYRVYRLPPTPSNDEAYCFGANKAEIDEDNSTYSSDNPTEETGNASTVTAPPTEEETDDPTLDPCFNYSQLPNAYDRYYYNIINGSSGSVLHDRHLVEGWYRAGLSLDMPTVAPSHLYCGTIFPVWLNGNLPNASEGIVERTACFLGNLAGNFCVHHLQIRVKDCGSYRVYYLYPTPSNDEAYCFGMEKIESDENKTTIPPANTTSSPVTAPPTEEETDDPPLDPCFNYSLLPNAYDRYYYNIISGSSGSVLHDRHLVEGWYRAGLSLDMPTVAPSHLYCGTYFPVWLNGNLPNASEGIVEQTACFLGNLAGNFCVHHLQIRVKDCGSYRVYYLYPTPSNDEAYCFGMEKIESDENKTTIPPANTTSSPVTAPPTEEETDDPTLDPCFNYSLLPNAYDRYYYNIISGSSGSVLHDRHLVEGWYRAGLSLDMPTVAPSHLYCGTYFPVWLNGNLPNASEGIVERTACFLGNLAGNFCVHHLQIRVKDCGSYRVYYLYPTPSNDEAYCFGMEKIESDENKTTIPPANTTSSPVTAPPTEEETDDPPLDPCFNYSLLPNAYDRYYYNIISGSSGSVLHDRHLVEGWYRAGLSLDMPTVAPSHLYCGTYFPVWLNGNLPNASEGIVEQTACFLGNLAGNYCVHHLQIRVKDCGSYRVYYLYPTPSNDEAYCFGMEKIESDENKTTIPPANTTSSPVTAPPTEEETDDPPLDPCFNYSLLPNAYDRYYYNIISGSSGSVLHDRHLVEGWYRAGLSLDMPTVAPSHLYCGTYFPVWLNGSVPNISEGIVERTACFLGNLAGNYCVHHLQIRVKDCGSYRVYYLYPTPSNDEAYCFGMEKSETNTTIPTSTTPSPPTTTQIDPCHSYTVLPSYEYRYVQNTVNENSSFIQDRNLTEGWYRAGNLDIPNSVPNLFHCGTLYPGYLTGLLPNATAGIVNRTVCFLGGDDNWCYHSVLIKIKNCGSYRVYLLKPTLTNSSAYCFGSTLLPSNISTTTSLPTTSYQSTTKAIPSQNITTTNITLTTDDDESTSSTSNISLQHTTTTPTTTTTQTPEKTTSTNDTQQPSTTTSTTGIQQPTTTASTNDTQQPTTTASTNGTQQLTTTSSANGTQQPTTTTSTNGTQQPTTTTSTNGTQQPATSTSGTLQPTRTTIPINGTQQPTTTTSTTNGTQQLTTTASTNDTQQPSTTTSINGTQQPTTTASFNGTQHPTTTTSTNGTQQPTTTTSTNGTQQPTTTASTNGTQQPTTTTSTNGTQQPATSTSGTLQPTRTTIPINGTQQPTTTASTNGTQQPTTTASTNGTQQPTTTASTNGTQQPATSTSGTLQPTRTTPTNGTQQSTTTTSTNGTQHSTATTSIGTQQSTTTSDNGTQQPTTTISTNGTQKPTTTSTSDTQQPTSTSSDVTQQPTTITSTSGSQQLTTTASTSDTPLSTTTATNDTQPQQTTTTTISNNGTQQTATISTNGTQQSTTVSGTQSPSTSITTIEATDLSTKTTTTVVTTDGSTLTNFTQPPMTTITDESINGTQEPLSSTTTPETPQATVSNSSSGITVTTSRPQTSDGVTTAIPSTLEESTTNYTNTDELTSTLLPTFSRPYTTPLPESENTTSTSASSTTSIPFNPCVDYTNLTYLVERFHTNQIQWNSNNSLSDHSLRYGWYGTGVYDLFTARATRYHCGANHPIWINGSIPSVGDGIVDRKACVVADLDCATRISIRIRNCGAFRVYQLRPTIVDSAYCIYDNSIPTTAGPTTQTQPASTIQPPPTISEAEVEINLVPEGISEAFQARCMFNATHAEGVRFNVSWYFDGEFYSSFSESLENIQKTFIYLQRDNFKTLGRNISCEVHMLNNDGSISQSRISSEKFLGIKILTPVVTFRRGEEGKIKIQLTVPIGCLQMVGQCDVILAMMDQSEDQCTGAAVSGQRDCGIALKSREWSRIYEIPVGAIEEEGHEYSATYQVVLRTDAHFHQPIWGLYELPPVKIVIEEGSDKEWSKKYCRAVNDPHLLTFDQRPYDVHLTGDFIMYQHKTAPIQVQARFKPCTGNSGPHCTCGVAVQVGRDVFVIDRCQSGRKRRRMLYTSCMDRTLEVRKRHDYLYNLYTPYGTRIQVNLRGKTYMNLQIYPSIRDVGHTMGLCGTLSNECADDFLLRDGSYLNQSEANKTCGNFRWSDYRWKPDTFSRSWMVAANESLFEDYDPSTAEWPSERYLCVCKKNVIKMRIDGRGTPDCSSSVVSNCTRRREKVVAVGGGCEVKRSSSKFLYGDLVDRRVKRSETRDRKIKMETARLTSIDNATSFCREQMFKSGAFDLCADVPNVESDDAVETCALDIELTNGSLEWVDNPKEALIDRCMSELRVNTTLNTHDNNTESVADKIRNIACPNNCSNVGTCVNGTCSCPPLLGASDCSLNVTIPPEIYGIEGDGFCDVSQMSCDQILIAGDDFTETETYHCKVDVTHVLFDGTTSSAGVVQTTGDMETLMSISCPVPAKKMLTSRIGLRMSPPFVRTFNVSLSSDGDSFSESFEFFQYNATYQELQIINGRPTFTLKTGYCYIDEQGVPDGWRSASDNCKACNSSINLLEWSPITTIECEVLREPVSQSNFDTSQLYWLLAVTLVIVLVVILVVCQQRFRRLSNSKKCSYDVASESSDKDIELRNQILF